MLATKPEIKLAVQAAIARTTAGWLYDEYIKLITQKRKYSKERQQLATIRTYLTEAAAFILAQGNHEERQNALKEAQSLLDRSAHYVRVSIDWGEPLPEPVERWFSAYAIIYCALRDIVVYFERHPERLNSPTSEFDNARKELLKRCRSAWSLITSMFQEEVRSGLGKEVWPYLQTQLQNEVKPYRFEAKIVGVA